MPTSLDGPQPPIAIAELAENFDATAGNRLYDGMVPNWSGDRSDGDFSQENKDTIWSWPHLGIGDVLARRPWFAAYRGNTTTQESEGLGTGGGNPTETTGGAAKALQSIGADGFATRYTSTNVSGNAAKIDTFASGFQRREMRPAFAAVLRIPTITSCRVWAGLFSATPEASDDPTMHGIGFRFTTSTLIGGTAQWAAWTNDGGVGGTVVTNTNTPVAATRYELAFFCPTTSSVAFFLNQKFFGLSTTNLPTATQGLDLYVGITTLSAAQRTIDVIRVAGHSA